MSSGAEYDSEYGGAIENNLIDKILVEMKSEFNKVETTKYSDSEAPYGGVQRPEEDDVEDISIKLEPSELEDMESQKLLPPQGMKRKKLVKEKKVKKEDGDKPRIVLTLRTEKSKVTSSCSAKPDVNLDDSGRRLLRNKSVVEDKKKPDVTPGLKRSARRRSKDCNESVLQSAIARKEKSYNETSKPQRLTRRLKPTPKILANLEMCQRNALLKAEKKEKRNAKSEAQVEDILNETPKRIADHLYRKFKRKYKHKVAKSIKRLKQKSDDSYSESNSVSSGAEVKVDSESDSNVNDGLKHVQKSKDVLKAQRRSNRRLSRRHSEEIKVTVDSDIVEPLSASVAEDDSIQPADPESSIVVDNPTIHHKCLCRSPAQYFVAPKYTASRSEIIYCTALDSVEDKVVGCSIVVSDSEIPMLRPSFRIPYAILCEVHRQRLYRHNCCPACGIFCSQGRFSQCSDNHQYHRECQVQIGDRLCCPHCASPTPDYDVEIVMESARKPVFLPAQKPHYPSAKMSFPPKVEPKEERDEGRLSPPLVPEGAIAIPAIDPSDNREKFDSRALFNAVKNGDCKKLAVILGTGDVYIQEQLPEYDGGTALHYASQNGMLPVVHMLVISGADLDALDREQNSALMLAICAHRNEVVRYLVKAGASVTLKGTDGMSSLHLAAKSGNLGACEYLMKAAFKIRGYVDIADDGGWTALVWACEHAHTCVARFLIKQGADPLLRDVEHNVALHWAAFSGSTQITELLLNCGCDVNAVNAHGDSPLHVAARQDVYNCVLLLLARGARISLINKAGETPLDCCIHPNGDCFAAISLNMQLQSVSAPRKHSILTNDISRGKEKNPIQCINVVDDEPIPTDYVYIIQNCITSDINIDLKITTLQSCQCEETCTSVDCLCCNSSLRCWYDEDGKLTPDFNYMDPPMIFECNPVCGCNAITCNNRVVQHGMTQRFQLFRTPDKGWGIKTLKTIPRGRYVCEYIGEVISDLEADQREDDSYLFDLDNRERTGLDYVISEAQHAANDYGSALRPHKTLMFQEGETYCIDARRYGNFARFINHSCEPNLLPVRVYVDHQDLRFPRIAFFANREIAADEELGFDYGEKFWIIKYKSFTCTCGTESCKYSEFTIQETLENYNQRLQELP